MFQKEYLVKSEDIIDMKNWSKKKCKQAYDQLRKRIAEDRGTNYLVIHVYAGHGIQVDGHQTLLTNEFDTDSKSYKRFFAESCVREIAD